MFGGGGALLFAKRPEKDEIYNDLDSNLFNMFRCIRDQPIAMVKELGFLSICGRDEFFYLLNFLEKEEFDDSLMKQELALAEQFLEPSQVQEYREIMQKREQEYNVARAAAFFKVMRYSFGAGGTSYACKGVDIRRFFYLIHQASRRIQGLNLENQHYKELIPHYDAKNILFYLDPPYWGAEDYKVPFTMHDHLHLRNLLRELKGFFILSYNDHPCIRYLYKDFHIIPLKRHNSLSMGKTKDYHELLIFNYDPPSPAPVPVQLNLY